MRTIKLLKNTILGCLLFFNTMLPLENFNPRALSRYIAIPFIFNQVTKQDTGVIKIVNDLESDLEYVLGIQSLQELTNLLTVYANGINLPQDTITTVGLHNKENSCSFSIKFPASALLQILQKDKVQLLLKTYRDSINEYITHNVHPQFTQIYESYHKTCWFKNLISILKIEIKFTYHLTDEDMKKECLSLLAIVLRKRNEVAEKVEEQFNTSSLGFSLLRTIVIDIKP